MTSHRKNRRAALLGATALAGALALATGTPAAAQEQRQFQFSQPVQPLNAALRAYGATADQQIIFADADIEGRTAPALNGRYTAEDALGLLLADTGLHVRRTDFGVLQISATPAPQSGSAAGDGADSGTVDTLVVTAQKREEDIQDVPIAISAFTQEDLTRSQVAGGPDLMTQVPNFTFTKTNFSGYSIQIRGIGTQAISATTDPAVAVAFNNTPFIRNRFFEQEFYDLQRVEVLRGPQGTLYGRNATAGVVNIISQKPSFQYEARLSGDVSNYNSTRLEGMINLPLSNDDNLALRIAGAWTKRDGYVKNLLTGEQTDGRDLWSTRVSLRAEPTDWLSINLIWEHFEEEDDRLRTGKQLCHADPGPTVVDGIPVEPLGGAINFSTAYFSQGCKPASLYSPDAFETPNGFALPYYGPLQQIGSPVYLHLNPYASELQSRDLREIETHLTPIYEAETNLLQLQVSIDLPGNLSLSSETGYSRDHIFSFSDLNRFDTTPGVFVPGGRFGGRYDVVPENGVFCDPQLGCTDRLAGGDLSTAESEQFSQEFRLSSNYEGPFNFNLGANFLRYDTEDKYYVFINTLTAYAAIQELYQLPIPWTPGVSDNYSCLPLDFYGQINSSPNKYYAVEGCQYIDPNDVRNLNDNGRNYFLSRNPYHLLSYAAFGEVYYQIAPNLKLTAGFRWTVDKKQAPQLPSWTLAGHSYGTPTRKVIEVEWQEPTGRLALDWKPAVSFTDETLVYGSYVRGYKAGGANPPPAMVVILQQGCPPNCDGDVVNTADLTLKKSLTHPERFEAEYVDAFEVGTKNTFLGGQVTANLAAFYYDYRGYQISQIVNRSAVNLNFDATVWGAELELDWRPLENLRLGFKGGYEKTRMADGSQAIDLMDRTAGKEGWILVRPFPTQTSNCVFPEHLVSEAFTFTFICQSYLVGLDPATMLPYVPNPTEMIEGFGSGKKPLPPELAGYPGYDPTTANNGEGFAKDLSGNELPNAPDFTATITADYTLPLPHDWLMTLHTDLYWQSEAWTRIFNTEGYDKLKAYSNINLAAIFTQEDAGWTVMAYVKNVLDRDNVTGAFLFSDDVGLTTNVFLNEPRLYGLRVTKNWVGGGDWWGGLFPSHTGVGPYPLTIEVGNQVQQWDTPGEVGMPFTDAFSPALDPRRGQGIDGFDQIDAAHLRLTYQPSGSPWKASASVRYGRTGTEKAPFVRQEEQAHDTVCSLPSKYQVLSQASCDPNFQPVTYEILGQTFYVENKYDEDNLMTPFNRVGATSSAREEHLIADFLVGRDVGMGMLGEWRSTLAAGVRWAQFNSLTTGYVNGVPDLTVPDGWLVSPATFTRHTGSFESEREFNGIGPVFSWEASAPVWEREGVGQVNVDWTITGGALFGKQEVNTARLEGVEAFSGGYARYPDWGLLQQQIALQPVEGEHRSESATVPLIDVSLGVSYEIQRFKVGAGYRWERYFDVLDAGYEARKTYDRTIDGPYFKLSIGFGG